MSQLPRFHVPFWLRHILVFFSDVLASVQVKTEDKNNAVNETSQLYCLATLNQPCFHFKSLLL